MYYVVGCCYVEVCGVVGDECCVLLVCEDVFWYLFGVICCVWVGGVGCVVFEVVCCVDGDVVEMVEIVDSIVVVCVW